MADFLPTYISGDEAIALARRTWKYAESVDLEVAAANLTPNDRAGWRNLFEAIHAWYNDVINRSQVSVWLGSKAIADDCEQFNNRIKPWHDRAVAAGAPATAGDAPAVPGTMPPGALEGFTGSIRWIAIAVVAVAAVSLVREVRR
ncbi:MAG: hypothetical protein EBR82_59945 [Caulobacteraceae bacterium]|nr:hypothetical protein [Caulobacteraceae bacterium]